MKKWSAMAVVLLALGGCHRAEYSQNYVSPSTKDFEQYQREASNRPSPPARSTRTLNGTTVYITYSQPGVKERMIWGDLVKYDKVWRTGANEATVFSVDQEIEIGGNKVPAGNYALYTIPSENEDWVVILNKKYDVWGAYDYEQTLDVMRLSVPVTKTSDFQERMKFDISKEGLVTFAWEYVRFSFPLSIPSN